MLPILIDAVMQPTPVEISVAGGLIVVLFGGFFALVEARAKKAEKEIEKLKAELAALERAVTARLNALETGRLHLLELAVSQLTGAMTTAASEIAALKKDGLPREYFKLAMRSQNNVLNSQSDALVKLVEKLEELERSKASRTDIVPVRAQMHRPPIRRTDGPSEAPSEPPRAQLPTLSDIE